ncbi:MAG: ABC-type transport auxiliary lipoprotein family protein [Deltaproteobacteria bacterium]|nr:ABC-type transport auxiliary lipoprotein family protein [Deltaproteobacteria bacterium]
MAPFFLAIILLGCGLGKPYPAINTFNIEPPKVPALTAKSARPLVILVNQLGVAAAYDNKKLIYKTRDGQMVEDFYNELVAPPSRLLADSQAIYLDRALPFAQVVRIHGQKGADFILEGYLAQMLGDFSQEPPVARISLAVTFNDTRRDKAQILLAKTYEVEVAFDSPKDRPAPEFIQALNQAWSEILVSLTEDLTAWRQTQKKP